MHPCIHTNLHKGQPWDLAAAPLVASEGVPSTGCGVIVRVTLASDHGGASSGLRSHRDTQAMLRSYALRRPLLAPSGQTRPAVGLASRI